VRNSTRRAPSALRYLTLLFALVLVVAACGGGSDSSSDDGGGGGGGSSEGTPVEGGKITYGLEGKTTNFCLPRAQLAISGIEVVEAVYDTLTRPTTTPDTYSPYLAKSVTPNADYTEWTIVVRDGITFQNGEPLNADAVKLNIDSWRGKGPVTSVLLLSFVYSNIADTAVTAPDTVVVKMTKPWVAFPAYLWTTGRTGIAAPEQLNSGTECDTKMIGTGPFKLDSFDPATGDVSVSKNASYWRKDSEGRQLPYLDGIDFKPQEESSQRVNGLQGGQFDISHFSGGKDLDEVKNLGNGIQTILEPNGRMEISQLLPNVENPPFNNLDCRKALAQGVDREALNQISNKGTSRLADQVFDTKITGYVDDPGFPAFDIDAAKDSIKKCKAANGGKFEFDLQSTFDQDTQALAAETKRQLEALGVTVNLPSPVDQAQIINLAVAGSVDSFSWRNYPGQDPDTLYVWFYGGSLVNFNHIDDATINQALDEGRSNPDPAARKEAYETFNKRMSSQAYNLWTWYTQWFLGASADVHGFVGPNLPNEAGEPGDDAAVDILAGYHQLLGIWVDK
jgi:peptide/nickel transport system substrate-binding protein